MQHSIQKESAAILSIFDGTRVRHINVERDEDGELTIGNSNFNSMPEIANYFKQNPVARNASGEELKLTKHLLVHWKGPSEITNKITLTCK